MNTARGYNGGAGTQTAALSMGGYTGSNITNVEKYDGSSWTNSTALPLGGRQFATSGAGTQTAGLAFGGYNNGLPPGNVTSSTEEYNTL